MIVISTLKFHVRKILILLFLISTTVLLLIFKRYSATNNKSDIIIAVLDTGVNLKRKIFSSLIQGYDVINDNNKIQDDNGHGTIVASIINRIEPKLKIMPIKAIPKSGFTDREYLAKGIIKAVDAGANIINISCGIVSSDKKLLDAVNYAEKNDVLIVAAVGNEGKYDSIQYPAVYDNVLAVGAVDDMNRRLELSNWGGQIDVVARGYEVSAIGLNGDKKYVSGTSASTPIVSAIAGKILIQRPDINVKELRKIIKYMAKDINTYGWDEDTGYGLMYENMDILKASSYDYISNYPAQLQISKSVYDEFVNDACYLFKIDFTCDIKINLNFYTIDFYDIEISNKCNNIIWSGEICNNDAIELSNVLPDDYKLEIKSAAKNKKISGYIKIDIFEVPDNYEYNNSIEFSAICKVGKRIICSIHTGADVDWFKFENNEFNSMEIEVTSLSRNIDPVIYIYNNRKLIATIDDNSVYDSEKYLLNYNDINQYNICIGNFLNTNETGKYELFINYTPIPK